MDQIETSGVAQDLSRVTDIPAYPTALDGPAALQNPGPGTYDTGYRVCPCSAAFDNRLSARAGCRLPVTDALGIADGSGNCAVNDLVHFVAPSPPTAPHVDEPLFWRWMTFQGPRGGELARLYSVEYRVGGDPSGLFGPRPAVEFSAVATFGSDLSRWRATPSLQEAYLSSLDLSVDQLGMVLWTHTPSSFREPERQLTSGYWAGHVDAPLDVVALPILDPSIIASPVSLDPRVCPRCAASFPGAFVIGTSPSGSGTPHCTTCPRVAFASGSVPASSIDASFVAFNVATVERWAVSADHDPYRGSEGLRAVGIGLQGTVIESLIAQHDGGYIDELISGCPKNRCNTQSLPIAVAELLAGDPPPPRHGYAAAMSGAARRLWLGGGVDGTGSAMTDIWEYDLAEQLWRQLPVSRDGRVGTVLAIAWSSPAQAIYVLDRRRIDHHRSVVRLLRVDPAGDDLVIEQTFDPDDMRAARYELAVGVEDDAWIIRSDTGSHATYSTLHLVRAAPGAEFPHHGHHDDGDCDDEDHHGHGGDDSTSTSASYVLARRDEGRGEVLPGAVSADGRGLSLLVRRDGNLTSVGLAVRADSHDGAHHR